MPSRVAKFHELIHNERLTPKEIFTELSVEYRDDIAMMHLKTLGKSDSEILLQDCFRASKKKKRRSKKRSRKRTKKRFK